MEAGGQKVGSALGAGRPKLAKSIGKAVLYAMLLVGLVVSIFFLVARDAIGHLFSSDPQVIRNSSQISVLVSVAYMLFAVTYSSFAVVQGQARAAEAMVCFVVGLWGVGTPLAYVIAFPLGQGFLGVWEGAIVGYGVMTVLLSWLVLRSDWAELSRQARERSEVEQQLAATPHIVSSHTVYPSPLLRAASLGVMTSPGRRASTPGSAPAPLSAPHSAPHSAPLSAQTAPHSALTEPH